ncbi:calcium-binding protein CP1 [Euphorbia lathyris]|uniref:calcium-binding protein CP1 n=1 Tax=Euphorbia lathyris TaxID=212925 RepID=UPI003313E808
MCPSGRTLATRTASSKPDFRTAFDVLDADRDGKISRDDLKTFYAGFPNGAVSDEGDFIATMMSVADFNNDGFVEYDEFERVLDVNNGMKKKKMKNGGGGGVMEDVFKVMDKDGDGKLNHEDLKNYMQSAGFDANDDDIRAMIKLGGGGDDINGTVSFHGLLRILSLDS